MIHDAQCELETNRGHGCNCGSRACPLCHGCRNGAHTQHKPTFEATIPSSAGTRKVTLQCDCPTCLEAA